MIFFATEFLKGVNDEAQISLGDDSLGHVATSPATQPLREIHRAYVFDAAVPDLDVLLSDVPPGVPVLVLKSQLDGVRQLATWARRQRPIDELHVVSHGSDGALFLGNAELSGAVLDNYAAEFTSLGKAFSTDAHVVLYGCEVAKTIKGQSFVNALADKMGAFISASCTVTGAAHVGGDWDLDHHTGPSLPEIGFSEATRHAFDGVLSTTVRYDETPFVIGHPVLGPVGPVQAAWLDGTSGAVDIPGFTLALDYGDHTSPANTFDNLQIRSYLPGSLSWKDGELGNSLQGDPAHQTSAGAQLVGSADFSFEAFSFHPLSTDDGSRDLFISGLDASGTEIAWEILTLPSSIDHTTVYTFTKGVGNWRNDPAWTAVRKVVFDWRHVFTISYEEVIFKQVTINLQPELGGTLAAKTVIEDVASQIDLSAYDVTDADGDQITLTLSVDRGTLASTDGSGAVDLDGAGPGGSVVIAGSGAGTMTLQGAAADLNTYLNDANRINYTTALNDAASATLTVTPNDGSLDGTADAVTLNITAVNDVPVLTAALPSDITLTEDIAGNLDISSVAIEDPDSDPITVTLSASTGTFGTPRDGSGIGTGVTATLVDPTTITLAGSAAAIDAYLNIADAIPFTGPLNGAGNDVALVTMRVNDGDGSGTLNLGSINIDIVPVNDAPVLTALDGDSGSGARNSLLSFDTGSDAVVTDVDNSDFNGGQFTVSKTTAFNGDFTLRTATASSGGDGTIAVGELVSVGGTVIGEIASDGQAGNDLVVTLNTAGATPGTVQNFLRALTYQSSEVGTHQFAVTLNDGDTGTSNSAAVSLAIAAPSRPPASVVAYEEGDFFNDGGALIRTVVMTVSNQGRITEFQIDQDGPNTSRTVSGTVSQTTSSSGTVTTTQTAYAGTILEDRDDDGVIDQIGFTEHIVVRTSRTADGRFFEEKSMTLMEEGTVVQELTSERVYTVTVDPVSGMTTQHSTVTLANGNGAVQAGTIGEVFDPNGAVSEFDVSVTVIGSSSPDEEVSHGFTTVDLTPQGSLALESQAIDNNSQLRAIVPTETVVESSSFMNRDWTQFSTAQIEFLSKQEVNGNWAVAMAVAALGAGNGTSAQIFDLVSLKLFSSAQSAPVQSDGVSLFDLDYGGLAAEYSVIGSSDTDAIEAITLDLPTDAVVDVTQAEVVFVTTHNVVVRTGAGDEIVSGFEGDQILYTGAGNDLLSGGSGNDLLDGGANRDAAIYGVAPDALELSGTRASAAAVGPDGTDTLTGVELIVFTGETVSGRDRVTLLPQEATLTGGLTGFNEASYLTTHKDVSAAVASGVFASGAEHYVLFGQSEGRLADLIFDEEFYLAHYLDVALAVQSGTFASGSEHYELFGHSENRSITPLFDSLFYLEQNADVRDAIDAGAFDGTYQHYMMFGDQEGRAASAFFDTAAYRAEHALSPLENALEHFLVSGIPSGVTAPTYVDF